MCLFIFVLTFWLIHVPNSCFPTHWQQASWRTLYVLDMLLVYDFIRYCRIGIYRATKILWKDDFSVFLFRPARGEFHAIAVNTRQLQIESFP